MLFTIDTSLPKRKNDKFKYKEGYSNEIVGKGTNDLRIAMISNNEKNGYSVEAFPKTYKFRKSYFKISFKSIQ